MKLTKKQQKLKALGCTGWLLTATKKEIDNCICNEWDGKGRSACGFPCPVHYKMSWERPIEEEILTYVRHMAENMESVASKEKETGWFANNRLQEDAQRMADAYRTVEHHIEDEIKIRKSI